MTGSIGDRVRSALNQGDRILQQMGKRKAVGQTDQQILDTQMNRCLSTLDITLLGIGHMIGSGVYVLTASVAKEIAGPAIVLSYMITGFASLLAALCYAEFAVRFPKAGSAYSYAYKALGEFCAFVVGWNMIMENVIGVAAVARSCAAYVDSLLGGILHIHTLLDSRWTGVWRLTDLLAIAIVMAVCVFLRFGVRTTSYLNNALSAVNLCVLLLLLVVGGAHSKLSNWQLPGRGFLPYGWKGVFAASGSCFYAFVGFESIAAAGEEAKNPQRSIPLATLASMGLATALYVTVSAVLTLMQPFDQLSGESGLPDALGAAAGSGVWAKYAVVLGACCGMACVLIGTMYALTRIVYAMCEDQLLPRPLGQLDGRAQVPLRPMYACAAVAALMAAIFPLTTLVEMMSIGTLLAYTLVSVSVIIQRYRIADEIANVESVPSVPSVPNTVPDQESLDKPVTQSPNASITSSTIAEEPEDKFRSWNTLSFQWNVIVARLSNLKESQTPTTTRIGWSVTAMITLLFALCLRGPLWFHLVNQGKTFFWIPLLLTVGSLIACVIFIAVHKQTDIPTRYRVPWVPLIPALSIVFNVTLMANLSSFTWMRLFFWMIAGLVVYFGYAMRGFRALEAEFSHVRCDARSWGSMDSPTLIVSTPKEEQQEAQ